VVLGSARERSRLNSFALPTLADLGSMIDFVDQTAHTVGPPSEDAPESYFTASSSSSGIGVAAEDTMSAARNLRERVRTGLALVSSVSTSQALEVAQESQASDERFQRTISILGAVIVGPALVAGVFGANTALPGKNGWWGFAIMIASMALSALVLLAILNRVGSRTDGG